MSSEDVDRLTEMLDPFMAMLDEFRKAAKDAGRPPQEEAARLAWRCLFDAKIFAKVAVA